MDRITPAQRSRNMAQVKSKNTKPELFVFDFLEKRGIIFERHFKIAGNPDIAFPEKKIAVFIDGEFWHGRNYAKERPNLPLFWIKKIGDNIKRDKKNRSLLKKEGWMVIRIWDKDLKRKPEKELKKILKVLDSPINL